MPSSFCFRDRDRHRFHPRHTLAVLPEPSNNVVRASSAWPRFGQAVFSPRHFLPGTTLRRLGARPVSHRSRAPIPGRFQNIVFDHRRSLCRSLLRCSGESLERPEAVVLWHSDVPAAVHRDGRPSQRTRWRRGRHQVVHGRRASVSFRSRSRTFHICAVLFDPDPDPDPDRKVRIRASSSSPGVPPPPVLWAPP